MMQCYAAWNLRPVFVFLEASLALANEWAQAATGFTT